MREAYCAAAAAALASGRPPLPRLAMPLHVFGGTHDRSCPQEHLAAWEAYAPLPASGEPPAFSCDMFEGGHFYTTKPASREALVKIAAGRMRAALDALPASMAAGPPLGQAQAQARARARARARVGLRVTVTVNIRLGLGLRLGLRLRIGVRLRLAVRFRLRVDGCRMTPATRRQPQPPPPTSHFPLPTSHFPLPTSHFPLLTPHTSHLTPHTSHLTPHTSHCTPHSQPLPNPQARPCQRQRRSAMCTRW